MKISDAVRLYVQLRDQAAALKAQYTEEAAKIKTKMDLLEAKLLDAMDKTGMDSVKTEAGTAYKSLRTSATLADPELFREFVKETGEWALADLRANKTGVAQWMAANDAQLPPGVSWREERVVNFRKPA